jgi:hypothetical protein
MTTTLPETFWDPKLEGRRHEIAWRNAMALYQQDGGARADRSDDALTLYYGNEWNGVRGGMVDKLVTLLAGGFDYSGYNLIQAITDTLAAHLVRNRVRPFNMTERADTEAQQRSQLQQQAIEGEFYRAGIYGELGIDMAYDGLLFDAAMPKITPDYANMRIECTRVMPWELQVPQREAVNRKPRQIYHTEVLERSVALARCTTDEQRDLVKDAPQAPEQMLIRYAASDQGISDPIMWVEGWHLPSGRVDMKDERSWGYEKGEFKPSIDPGHDGRRVLCLERGTLIDEPWPFDYFPIPIFRQAPKRRGFWSRSIPEQLAPAQELLNRMNRRLDGIMHLHARPLLVVWRQARLNVAKLSNGYADVLETSVPPSQALQYITPQSVPAEYVRRVDQVIQWAEKTVGLSEFSIGAVKPQGIDHAPALRMIKDTEGLRHTPLFRGWEMFHVDMARTWSDGLTMLDRHSSRSDKPFELVFGTSRELVRVKWSQLRLEDERYRWKTWPTNLLPMTPEAKAEKVIEWIESGGITPDMGMKLLADEFYDVEAIVGDSSAPRANIEKRLAKLLSTGEMTEDLMPQPYLDQEMAETMVVQRINRLEADGVSDERIEPLRKFYEELKRGSTPSNDGSGAGGGVPGAAGAGPGTIPDGGGIPGAGAPGGVVPGVPGPAV